MSIPYPDHFGASDESPARLDVRVVRGDDWHKEMFFAYAHRNHHTTPVSIVETPFATDHHVFNSAIFHIGSGEVFADFEISDLPLMGEGWIDVRLREHQTGLMEPGTYGFWISSANVDAGEMRTWINGTITILQRPDWGTP